MTCCYSVPAVRSPLQMLPCSSGEILIFCSLLMSVRNKRGILMSTRCHICRDLQLTLHCDVNQRILPHVRHQETCHLNLTVGTAGLRDGKHGCMLIILFVRIFSFV